MHLYFCNTMKFCKSLSWCTHQVLNHSKQTQNEEDMRLELERSVELLFLKNFETNYQLSVILFLCVFCVLLLCFGLSKNICSSPVCTSNEHKQSLNLIKEWEKLLWKCLVIGICSMMCSSTLALWIQNKVILEETCCTISIFFFSES